MKRINHNFTFYNYHEQTDGLCMKDHKNCQKFDCRYHLYEGNTEAHPSQKFDGSLCSRSYQQVTLDVIGRCLGITRERVRQITLGALRKFAIGMSEYDPSDEDLKKRSEAFHRIGRPEHVLLRNNVIRDRWNAMMKAVEEQRQTGKRVNIKKAWDVVELDIYKNKKNNDYPKRSVCQKKKYYKVV